MHRLEPLCPNFVLPRPTHIATALQTHSIWLVNLLHLHLHHLPPVCNNPVLPAFYFSLCVQPPRSAAEAGQVQRTAVSSKLMRDIFTNCASFTPTTFWGNFGEILGKTFGARLASGRYYQPAIKLFNSKSTRRQT